jgi:hypothetical protein
MLLSFTRGLERMTLILLRTLLHNYETLHLMLDVHQSGTIETAASPEQQENDACYRARRNNHVI